MKAGIESISFYVPRYYLDLAQLAAVRHVDPDKYRKGIGQEKMALSPLSEDVVTMGAQAAEQALEGVDRSQIDTLMFATESGIDQSKAAAIYVHHLLNLPSTCKPFELKQACSSGTAGLMMALALVRQYPKKKVLLVASDIARYGLSSAGEPTQGAGAVAMVISAHPRIVEVEPECGSYTDDVMDFWRPNYCEEAFVDGKYSIRVYLKALTEAWKHYVRESGRSFADHTKFCYHLPFTRMAEKAHNHLSRHFAQRDMTREQIFEQIEESLSYNRVTGNIYTASLYVGLASLLEGGQDLTNQRLGMFSYGSGCLAYFFSGVVQDGYAQHLKTSLHKQMLSSRIELSYAEYEELYSQRLPQDGRSFVTPESVSGGFRLKGVESHQRIYERVINSSKPVTHVKRHGVREQPSLVMSV